MTPNILNIKIADSVAEAPTYGAKEWVPLKIDQVLIVRGGMKNGKATVDIQLVGPNGQKYITMLTGSVLEGLAASIAGVNARG